MESEKVHILEDSTPIHNPTYGPEHGVRMLLKQKDTCAEVGSKLMVSYKYKPKHLKCTLFMPRALAIHRFLSVEASVRQRVSFQNPKDNSINDDPNYLLVQRAACKSWAQGRRNRLEIGGGGQFFYHTFLSKRYNFVH